MQQAYRYLYDQHSSAWTQELDLRYVMREYEHGGFADDKPRLQTEQGNFLKFLRLRR